MTLVIRNSKKRLNITPNFLIDSKSLESLIAMKRMVRVYEKKVVFESMGMTSLECVFQYPHTERIMKEASP